MDNSNTFKHYYNAATKRFPRPERPDPLEYKEASQFVSPIRHNIPSDPEYSEFNLNEHRAEREGMYFKNPTSSIESDSANERYNGIDAGSGRGNHENISTVEGRATSKISNTQKMALESVSGHNSGSESAPHGLLPDVDEAHTTISNLLGLPESLKNHHSQKEPSKYRPAERSIYSENNALKRLTSSRPKQSTAEKSIQVEMLSDLEHKQALQGTIGQLQAQLCAALALLREYSSASASIHRNAIAHDFSFSHDPYSDLLLDSDWKGEDGDRNTSPVLAMESETVKQLISLASDASLPSSAPISPQIFPDPPDRSPGPGPGRRRHLDDDDGAPIGRDLPDEEKRLKERLLAMDDFVAAMMQENERLAQHVAAADGEVAALRAECAALQRTRLALEAERESASADRAAMERELVGLRAEAGKLIETLDGACRDRTSLAARLDDALAELGRAASRLRGSRAERDALLERQVQMQVELDRFVRWHRRARREQSRLVVLEEEADMWRRVLRGLDEELRALLRDIRQLLHSEV